MISEISYYKFLRPNELEDIELKYFIYSAFHKIKSKLDVVFRFGSRDLVPIFFFEQVQPSASMKGLFTRDETLELLDYDFSRTISIDGFCDGFNQFIAINPFREPPRILEIIAHECKHLQQNRRYIQHFVSSGIDIKKEFTKKGIEKHIKDEDYSSYRNNPNEIEAREFASKYRSWKVAARLFLQLDKYKGPGNILDSYDMLAYNAFNLPPNEVRT